MRRMLPLLLLLALPLAQAADPAPAPAAGKPATPASAIPLPAIPPPPPELSPLDEPQVTIKKRDGETVEEFRLNGQLYMIKVTPTSGPAYYLVDKQGNGSFVRQDFDSGVRPPMWVIKTF